MATMWSETKIALSTSHSLCLGHSLLFCIPVRWEVLNIVLKNVWTKFFFLVYAWLLFLFEKILFLNWSLHSVLFCISFRYIAEYLDTHILYKVLPQYFQYPLTTYIVIAVWLTLLVMLYFIYIPLTILQLPFCAKFLQCINQAFLPGPVE